MPTRLTPVAAIAWALAAAAHASDRPLEFNRDVRPILAEHCFACHGPDSASRKADLRLDKREAAVKSGAIVPGDPVESEIIERVNSAEADKVMPPPKAHKDLSAAQKETLRQWVAEGAEYQQHWSLIAPKRPALPAVKNADWAKNPIDAFILAGLEAKGLKPSPEADRRTLARRAALDITGLPPTPADVDALVADASPDAYEKYVDKLMASPRWGEHRARYWLDAARYADSHGIHFDNYREMYSYRDWVIKAFNANMPFDRFTREQVAGDILPNRTPDQQVASGFNRNNITTNEGGAISEEYLVLYARDRTETFSQVWMGLTTGCAVCHDHKFDPFSQKEFYELSAFFNNTTQAAMDGNVKDTPPVIFLPGESDRERWTALEGELAQAKQRVDSRREAARPDFDKWLAGLDAEKAAALAPSDGLVLRASLEARDAAPSASTASPLELAEVGDFEKDRAFSAAAWVKPSKAGLVGAIVARMDDGNGYRGWDLWMDGGKPAMHIINDWPGNALKVIGQSALKVGQWSHVLATYDGSGKAGGVRIYVDGMLQEMTVATDALKSTIRATVPLKVGRRHNSAALVGAQVRDVRVYGRSLAETDAQTLAGADRAATLVAMPADKRPAAEVDALYKWYLGTYDNEYKSASLPLAALTQERAALKARGTVAHVMNERPEPAMAAILFRGDYDKPRDKVQAATPASLPPMAADLPKNRLGLAEWLLRPEHPLTARVTVNRDWQELFGTGIVRTAGDFGVTGEAPSHPELLDWLAVDFRESGWDVKRFYRQMFTSATYRQSAATSKEAVERDPANRLLSRGPRFRMDAEMVRDYALAASGLLVEKVGGPSVKPYQPDGVWEAVAMPESDTRSYRRDTGDKLYRRSLYTFWKRAAPPASMDIFNAPNRETCVVRRERTNTPLQALVTLNDPQFVEAARSLAESVLKSSAEDSGRMSTLSGRLLSRPFRDEESRVIAASLAELTAYYKAHPEDAAKLLAFGDKKADASLDGPTLAAWSMLANELMNLDEVLNK